MKNANDRHNKAALGELVNSLFSLTNMAQGREAEYKVQALHLRLP